MSTNSMDTDDEPEVETVSANGYDFLVVSSRTYDDITEVRFGVPSNDGRRALALSCILFAVSDDPTTPITLEWVGYYPGCATPTLSEDGGTVAMMRSMLDWLRTKFPRHDRIHLMDTSKLNRCYQAVVRYRGKTHIGVQSLPDTTTSMSSTAQQPIELAYHSVLLYGQTWYQRHFGATLVPRPTIAPENRIDLRRAQHASHNASSSFQDPETTLRECREILERPPDDEVDFEGFWNAFVRPHPYATRSDRWLDNAKDTMRQLWDEMRVSQGTWQTFFRAVNEQVGCGVFKPIIEYFAKDAEHGLGLNMSSWSWEIRLPATRGGGRRASVARATRANNDVRKAALTFFDSVDRLRRWEQVPLNFS